MVTNFDNERPISYEDKGLMGVPALDETFTRWQHDTDDILQSLEYELKGFEKDGKNWATLINRNGEFNERYPNALVNNRGIKDIMRVCRMNFNKISNTTNLNEKEVHQMALDFEYTIIDMLHHHYETYDIKSPEDLDVIFGLIRNPYFAMLKQSFLDGTRKYLGSIMKYGESFENIDRDALGDRMPMNKPSRLKKLFGG